MYLSHLHTCLYYIDWIGEKGSRPTRRSCQQKTDKLVVGGGVGGEG